MAFLCYNPYEHVVPLLTERGNCNDARTTLKTVAHLGPNFPTNATRDGFLNLRFFLAFSLYGIFMHALPAIHYADSAFCAWRCVCGSVFALPVIFLIFPTWIRDSAYRIPRAPAMCDFKQSLTRARPAGFQCGSTLKHMNALILLPHDKSRESLSSESRK